MKKMRIIIISLILWTVNIKIHSFTDVCEKGTNVSIQNPKLFNIDIKTIENVIDTTKSEIIRRCGCKAAFSLFVFFVENREYIENLFHAFQFGIEDMINESISYIQSKKNDSSQKSTEANETIDEYIVILKKLKETIKIKQKDLINYIEKYYPIKKLKISTNNDIKTSCDNNLLNQQLLEVLGINKILYMSLLKLKKYSFLFPTTIKNYNIQEINSIISKVLTKNITCSFENNEQNIKKFYENIIKFTTGESFKKIKNEFSSIKQTFKSSINITEIINKDAIIIFILNGIQNLFSKEE